MENDIKDRFVFTYESGVNGSFLVASTSKNDSIVEFQVSMLSKNPNKYILPLDVRRNNDRINIYYNITSKLSLSQYLRRSQISKIEFIDIFMGIVKTLLNSKVFLLSDNSFIIDQEYIYISPDTMCISLVYLPIKLDIDITRTLKDFAMNFVVYNANIYEEDSDNFLQQFLSFLKKDTFNILDFDKFLKETKRSIIPSQEIEPQSPPKVNEEDKKTPVNIEKPEQKENDPSQNRLKVDIPKPKSAVNRDSKNSLPSNQSETKVEGKKSGHIDGKDILNNFGSRPNVVIGAVIQATIVIADLILLITGTLDSLGDKVSTVFGLLLVSAAASYFMWKNVLKLKIKAVDSKVPAEKPASKPPKFSKPDKTGVREPEDIKKAKLMENTGTGSNKVLVKTPKTISQSEPSRQVEEEIKHDASVKISKVNETVFLGSSALKNPHLQIINGGSIEDIVVNKPSFVIGRLEGQVDYVHSNSAVGKVHAEIITRAGCYYLKDLNSKNGTYINGKRIESNKEYEIKNNDKITLANSDFVFIVL